MLEVRAKAYNLYMPRNESIKHERLILNRLSTYKEKFGSFESPNVDENVSSVTADATIEVPSEITSPEEATKYAQDYVRPYSRLLSF